MHMFENKTHMVDTGMHGIWVTLKIAVNTIIGVLAATLVILGNGIMALRLTCGMMGVALILAEIGDMVQNCSPYSEISEIAHVPQIKQGKDQMMGDKGAQGIQVTTNRKIQKTMEEPQVQMVDKVVPVPQA